MKYREEIHRYVQEHKDEIINTLGELVKIPSFQTEPKEGAPYGEACADILKYVQSCWQNNGFQTELYQNNGYLLSYYGHGNAHQPDECITIEGFLDAIELITHMVLECDKVS